MGGPVVTGHWNGAARTERRTSGGPLRGHAPRPEAYGSCRGYGNREDTIPTARLENEDVFHSSHRLGGLVIDSVSRTGERLVFDH